jgi:hypothetical protein
MRSHKTERFDNAFEKLPEHIKRQAREAYRRFKQDPFHPGLRFKQIHPSQSIYSVRINNDYRAVGRRNGDEIVWFWIGSHAEYDHLSAGR